MLPGKGRPLFIVGNKRSGTSMLVRMLDSHPRIFLSHESDIVWILFQFHGRQDFAPHPWDSGRGMDLTLRSCGRLLSLEKTPLENFHEVQTALMELGNPWLPAMKKAELDWIGDKKPFQHADPQLVDFITRHLPGARFIHIVRHPFAVVASASRFNRTRDGDVWKETTLEEKVERWVFHEEKVLELKRRVGEELLDVRYEDLCERPAEELTRVLRFLGMEVGASLMAQTEVLAPAKRVPGIRCSDRARELADLYGYSLPTPGTGTRLARACAKWFKFR